MLSEFELWRKNSKGITRKGDCFVGNGRLQFSKKISNDLLGFSVVLFYKHKDDNIIYVEPIKNQDHPHAYALQKIKDTHVHISCIAILKECGVKDKSSFMVDTHHEEKGLYTFEINFDEPVIYDESTEEVPIKELEDRLLV